MTARNLTRCFAAAAFCTLAGSAQAQVPQYGANVTHEQARKVLAAARRNFIA